MTTQQSLQTTIAMFRSQPACSWELVRMAIIAAKVYRIDINDVSAGVKNGVDSPLKGKWSACPSYGIFSGILLHLQM